MVGSRELGGLMAKDRKSATAEKSVRRDVKETAAVEQYWHAAGRPKSRKPPKDYKYVDELAHLQFELIKLQEWVRLHGLKVAVIFEGRDACRKRRGHQTHNPEFKSSRVPCGCARHADKS